MLGEAIVSRLTTAQAGDTAGQTAALAVLTAAVGTRVYPGRSDRGIYPMVVYKIRQLPEDCIDPIACKQFMVTLTLTVNGAGAYKTAQSIKQAIRTLLDRSGGTWGGVVVKGFWLDESDEDDFADAGNADALYYELDEDFRVMAEA